VGDAALDDANALLSSCGVVDGTEGKRESCAQAACAALLRLPLAKATLRKTAFLSHLCIKTITLPRQARDKHGKLKTNAVYNW
jgi:hypothetical protein